MKNQPKPIPRNILIVGCCVAALLGLVVYNFPPERVDLEKIEMFLKSKQWKEADIETSKAITALVTRRNALQRHLPTLLGEPVYTSMDIETAPCKDLLKIDQMWGNYSDGKFGFTIQYRIWLESQPKNLVPNDYQYNHYIKQTYEAFENRVGWRKNGWSVKYPKAFNLSINDARQGQFPSWIWIAEGSEGVGGKPYRDLGIRLKTMLDHIATCKMRHSQRDRGKEDGLLLFSS